ncbi:MAG TPA: cyclase family protein [Eubacteriales bacterium]|nr:cyclase family protein [Eubacteriales bacterium]
MKIYDISQELTTCEVFTGDIAPQVTMVKNIADDEYNLSNLTMCVHNGTHIDAPKHFLADGKAVDELPLAYFIGKAQVVEANGKIDETAVNAMNLEAKRVLFKGNGVLTESGAVALAEKGVILVGTESQSVGDSLKPMEVHKILLKEKIIPLEGIRLGSVKCGEYYLLAQPLNIAGCDGSPVRAVLIDKFDE